MSRECRQLCPTVAKRVRIHVPRSSCLGLVIILYLRGTLVNSFDSLKRPRRAKRKFVKCEIRTITRSCKFNFVNPCSEDYSVDCYTSALLLCRRSRVQILTWEPTVLTEVFYDSILNKATVASFRILSNSLFINNLSAMLRRLGSFEISRRFRGAYYFYYHPPDNWRNKHVWKSCQFLRDYTAQPLIWQSSSDPEMCVDMKNRAVCSGMTYISDQCRSSWICGQNVGWKKERKERQRLVNLLSSAPSSFVSLSSQISRCTASLVCFAGCGVVYPCRWNCDGGYPRHFHVVGFKIKDKGENLARQFLMFFVPWLVSWFFSRPSYITQRKDTLYVSALHVAYIKREERDSLYTDRHKARILPFCFSTGLKISYSSSIKKFHTELICVKE